jgi:hypothetical protein
VDVIRTQDVEQLASPGASPRVSIFLPTHRTGPETAQDPIRLRNLLSQADEDLRALGL